ncbi:hypothetical protein MXD63_33210 [Frankia sp. Cpl3]|nr:hypothetical protein [Frankia sp. Cpl3]
MTRRLLRYRTLSTTSQVSVGAASSQVSAGLPRAGATPPRSSATQVSVRPLAAAKVAMVSPARVYRALVSPITTTALPAECEEM